MRSTILGFWLFVFASLDSINITAAVGSSATPTRCWESAWQSTLERSLTGLLADREYLNSLKENTCANLAKLAEILLEDLATQIATRLERPFPVAINEPDWSKLDIKSEWIPSAGVLLLLVIDSSGRVKEVQLKKSSGNGKIDALCVEALGASLFRPARSKGRYVESELVISVDINVRRE